MNIFVLDKNPQTCSIYHVDKHVVKMILETTQLLNNALIRHFPGYEPVYKKTHFNHPCSMFAAGNMQGMDRQCKIGLERNQQMRDTLRKRLDENNRNVVIFLQENGFPPEMPLKKKYLVSGGLTSFPSKTDSGGNRGRAGRAKSRRCSALGTPQAQREAQREKAAAMEAKYKLEKEEKAAEVAAAEAAASVAAE